MQDWLLQHYDSIRAAHIIFVIAWMAALLMMPRFYIYQMGSTAGEPLFDTMSSATDRLRRIIMNPAMALTWLFGSLMLAANWDYLISQPWIHVKLTTVVILSGMHGWLIALGRKLRAGDAGVSEKSLRLLNELPFILAIIAVIMVVVQPFGR